MNLRIAAGMVFAGTMILGCLGILAWMASYDKRHPRTGHTAHGTPLVQCPHCDHPPFLGAFAAEAYADHLQSDHIRHVVGEVGE